MQEIYLFLYFGREGCDLSEVSEIQQHTVCLWEYFITPLSLPSDDTCCQQHVVWFSSKTRAKGHYRFLTETMSEASNYFCHSHEVEKAEGEFIMF